MGWEARKKRLYYYEARRENGRVVKQYIGTGPLAEAIAALRAMDRGRKIMVRAARGGGPATRARKTTRRVAWLLDVGERLVRAWLTAAGYHRPGRGVWRKKRGWAGDRPMELMTRKPFDEWDPDALARAGGHPPKRLAARAAKGDVTALPALEKYLGEHPAAVTLFGDVGRQMLLVLIRNASKKDLLYERAILHQADVLRRRLAGETPNAVEVLLAERAVVCWMTVSLYEHAYFAGMGMMTSYREHAFHEQRVEAANRRFLAALKALAAVRRLKLPDVLAIVKVETPPEPRVVEPETG